jgi:hypothetical protein
VNFSTSLMQKAIQLWKLKNSFKQKSYKTQTCWSSKPTTVTSSQPKQRNFRPKSFSIRQQFLPESANISFILPSKRHIRVTTSSHILIHSLPHSKRNRVPWKTIVKCVRRVFKCFCFHSAKLLCQVPFNFWIKFKDLPVKRFSFHFLVFHGELKFHF